MNRNYETMGLNFSDLRDMSKDFVGELKNVAQKIITNQKATDAAKTAVNEAQKEVAVMKKRNQIILFSALGVGALFLLRK